MPVTIGVKPLTLDLARKLEKGSYLKDEKGATWTILQIMKNERSVILKAEHQDKEKTRIIAFRNSPVWPIDLEATLGSENSIRTIHPLDFFLP